jgi:hypothetical protein
MQLLLLLPALIGPRIAERFVDGIGGKKTGHMKNLNGLAHINSSCHSRLDSNFNTIGFVLLFITADFEKKPAKTAVSEVIRL